MGGLSVVNAGLRARERTQVYVVASDPVSRDGAASLLRGQGVDLVDGDRLDADVVALVVVDELDDETGREIRSLRRSGVDSIVVIATRVDDSGLLAAVEAGAKSFLRRGECTPQNLIGSIHAARLGEGSLPPDLLGRLLGQVGRLQRQVLSPNGLTFSGLTEREVKVLRLLADGLDTSEVGRQLFLSERTVKNVVHDVTSRLGLRNRTHAVAHALRHGLI